MVKTNWNKLNIPKKIVSTHKWTAEHAAIVHEVDPARPWVDVTVQETDLVEILQENIQQSNNFSDAFQKTAEDFGDRCQQNIQDDRWDYPSVTVRSDGSTVSSPRNIIDTKELYNSYEMEVKEL